MAAERGCLRKGRRSGPAARGNRLPSCNARVPQVGHCRQKVTRREPQCQLWQPPRCPSRVAVRLPAAESMPTGTNRYAQSMRRLCSSPAKRGRGGAVPRPVPAPCTRHLLALHAGVATVKAGEVAPRTVEVARALTVTACTPRVCVVPEQLPYVPPQYALPVVGSQ
jgi:hypothetical protein